MVASLSADCCRIDSALEKVGVVGVVVRSIFVTGRMLLSEAGGGEGVVTWRNVTCALAS